MNKENIINEITDCFSLKVDIKGLLFLEQENKLLKHRLGVANDFIESRKENMIIEHYNDLKYIINECDLNSTW